MTTTFLLPSRKNKLRLKHSEERWECCVNRKADQQSWVNLVAKNISKYKGNINNPDYEFSSVMLAYPVSST